MKWTKYIPMKPFPKQQAFLMLGVKEALFGGRAGGGKSEILLAGALQYVDIPGYAAIIFRRTLTDLKQPGALIDRAHKWLSGTDATWSGAEHTWYFPTWFPDGRPGHPAKLAFGYMGEADVETRYQSAEYQYCVAPETPVLMSDGTYKPMCCVRVGDYVTTLNGSRKVLKTFKTRKPCVRVTNGRVSQIQSTSHRILTLPFPKDDGSTKLGPTLYTASWQSYLKYDGPVKADESQDQDLLRKRLQRLLRSHLWMEKDALSADGQNGCTEYYHQHPENQQPLLSSVLAEHAVPVTHSSSPYSLAHETSDVLQVLQELSCLGGCSADSRRYGESATWTGDTHPRDPQIRDGAGRRIQFCLHEDGQGNTPRCSPRMRVGYAHPYDSGRGFHSCFSVDGTFFYEPLGDSRYEVCDIQVEGSSHYITQGGFVNSNCGWDEVTQHEEAHYLYLFSRLRRIACPIHQVDSKGSPVWDDGCSLCSLYRQVPLRVRSATNPGGRGHEWVRNRFAIDYDRKWTVQNANEFLEEKVSEEDLATPEECIQRNIDPVFVGRHPTRKFIPSYLRDNPYIDQQNYEESLENLPPTERRRLRFGDWTDNPDSRFKRKWSKKYSIRGEYFCLGRDGVGRTFTREKISKIFATVDPAASVREGPIEDQLRRGRESSWTVISTWALTVDYHLLWLDMVRFQDEIPEVGRQIIGSFKKWRQSYFKIESNGLGKGVAQHAAQSGVPVKETTRHTDKLVNATSAIVRMEAGRVWFPQYAHWLETAETEIFSWIGDPSQRDDIVDTLADACNEVNWQAIAGSDADMVGSNMKVAGSIPMYVSFAG